MQVEQELHELAEMIPEYFILTDDRNNGKFARINKNFSYQMARKKMHTKIIGNVE